MITSTFIIVWSIIFLIVNTLCAMIFEDFVANKKNKPLTLWLIFNPGKYVLLIPPIGILVMCARAFYEIGKDIATSFKEY